MRAHSRNPAPRSGDAPALRLAVASVVDDAASSLTACSVCLRVRRGSDWVDAEAAIRELRSFDLAAAPRLSPSLCDRCVRSLRERRARPTEAFAA